MLRLPLLFTPVYLLLEVPATHVGHFRWFVHHLLYTSLVPPTRFSLWVVKLLSPVAAWLLWSATDSRWTCSGRCWTCTRAKSSNISRVAVLWMPLLEMSKRFDDTPRSQDVKNPVAGFRKSASGWPHTGAMSNWSKHTGHETQAYKYIHGSCRAPAPMHCPATSGRRATGRRGGGQELTGRQGLSSHCSCYQGGLECVKLRFLTT